MLLLPWQIFFDPPSENVEVVLADRTAATADYLLRSLQSRRGNSLRLAPGPIDRPIRSTTVHPLTCLQCGAGITEKTLVEWSEDDPI